MPTSPTPITSLPTAPSRADSANFATRADAFLGALGTFGTQANAIATNAYNNAVEADVDAASADASRIAAAASQTAAASSAAAAATSATAADTSATTAATQAANATSSATAASGSASSASGSAATATTKASEANTSATNAAASAAAAASSATNASASASGAATSAGNASTSATNAANSANAASAASAAINVTANVTVWVSGTSYLLGAVVYSPVNFQNYRRIVAGAGTTDPSADLVNWRAVGFGPSSIGTRPDQVPLNQQLGSMAYQDQDAVNVGRIIWTDKLASGYATGAGAAVTQLTSRTTGVTINAPCGAVTLFSAAGSTTDASFTVTNSTVQATDVIVLSQRSGANKYVLLVTAVANGSFEVTVYTTGGTTTEAPVINFAVIEAATA